MKDKVIKILFIIFIIFTLNYLTIFAEENLSKFLNYEQDILIIGKVTKVYENSIEVDVTSQIINKKIAKVTNVEKLKVSNTIKIENIKEYDLFKGSKSKKDKILENDIILASLNKKGDKFISANGIYLVDSMNYANLNVLYLKDNKDYRKTALIIKEFINSNGAKKRFKSDEKNVYYNGKVINDSRIDYKIEHMLNLKENKDVIKNEKDNIANISNNEALKIIIGISFLVLIILIINYLRKCN